MDKSDLNSTDNTSIKPVSSLRSRFENLSQSNEHLPQPQPQQQQPKNIAATPLQSHHHVDSLPPPIKKRQPTPTRPRPSSTISPIPSPPTVHVESPSSPPKNYLANLHSANNSKLPSTPASVSVSGSATVSPISSVTHSRSPSRATTPALEARMAAFLQAAQVPDNSSEPEKRETNGSQKPKPHLTAGHPPPVNRAGKPKLAALPTPSLNTADSAHTVNNAISPFNTPPSSSDGTPPLPSSRANFRNTFHASPKQSYFFPQSSQRPLPDHGREMPPEKPARPTTQPPVARSYPPPPSRYQPSRVVPTQDGTEESQPGLPQRPNSGRTSPVRQPMIPARRSLEMPRRSDNIVAETNAQFMPPPRRSSRQSALSQGFGRPVSMAAVPQKSTVRAIPAPQRSMSTRTESVRIAPAVHPTVNKSADDYDDPPVAPQGVPQGAAFPTLTEYPNASQSNRRPPQFAESPWEIATGYDTRLFAVSGEYVCTTGYITRAWNLKTGELCLTLAHGEGIKVSALAFKPTPDVEQEGKRLWLGTSAGEIYEIDIPSQSVVRIKDAHPRQEIVKLYRHASQLWSLDASGTLNIWPAGRDGMPSLETIPSSFSKGVKHSCSIVVGGQLWLGSVKSIYVLDPNATSDAAFSVIPRPLKIESAGDITSMATISSKPDLIYVGHSDGKISIYNKLEYRCVGLVNVSPYKISSLSGAGNYLWAGYGTGKIYVYDTSTSPWRVVKDWQAHDKAVTNIITDRQSLWKMGRLQVVSLGLDNMIRPWDGLLEEDWLESQMQSHDDQFCKFQEITAAVLTWNAGATKPTYLKNDPKDSSFFRDYLTSCDPPDIFIFGFQELVDLEDKKVTAKSFFKSKKKDSSEQEHVGHQYRAWRDHISRCIEDHLSADQAYAILHTSSMVGLFSCVFVKNSLRSRIRQVNASEIKRGMGGLHGNKGALIIRMVLDDSSICLVNCHLAAGQAQTSSRNNDAAAILEASCLPEVTQELNRGTFVGGGDGSMILDHELCIWNGDLNYRIDAMPRDAVVRAVREKNLAKLLERDQLLLSRRKNPMFRLQVFQEMPITFAPTYKYNVGTDEYDSSEKKRAPAWCDRVLFRGMGQIKGEDYRRWEVRVSDHRPVSARFRMRVKKVDEQRRRKVWQSMEQGFHLYQDKIAAETKLDYLINVLGIPNKEAMSLLK